MSSNPRKVTLEDLEEGNFAVMLKKVVSGRCCIPGCEGLTQLVFHSRSDKPYLCNSHLEDGEDTHTGEYASTNNSYSAQWTCCQSSWKKCHCRILGDYYCYRSEIPVTDEQQRQADEKEEAARIRAEENERWERVINAGYEPSYDRS